MKTTKYILLALTLLGLTASCMDSDWSAPAEETGVKSYGNKYIQATNLKTIAELKALYSGEINNNGLKVVKEAMQIRGIVTGNDEGGNIYNTLYIQDATGAIAVSVAQGGLYGPFAVGQAVLVELQGLYVGGYGKQPQIGTSYTNPNREDATPQVGRMSRYQWQEHYRLLSKDDALMDGINVTPTELTGDMGNLNIAQHCGLLVKLKGVVLSEADGKAVFAPDDGSVPLTSNCANRSINGLKNVVLRTSTYANFAKSTLPTGRVNITAVASRYNDTWQLLMRTERDIEAAE